MHCSHWCPIHNWRRETRKWRGLIWTVTHLIDLTFVQMNFQKMTDTTEKIRWFICYGYNYVDTSC
jgi:hypothetical protein